MNSIFIDANILIDLIDTNRTRHYKSKYLLKKLLLNNFRLGISEDMISNIYYISKRSKVDEQKLLNYLQFWTNNAEVLFFGNIVIQKSLEYCKKNLNSDLEDVLQSLCAKENGFDCILTEDSAFVRGIIETKNINELCMELGWKIESP